jgi:phospholipid/cholesterol/gamma-HCH transport system ATP-binding protein
VPGETEVLIEDLHKAFAGNVVLSGIDLVIRRGEVVAVVGGSGCGKTVLINHVLGQLVPDRGRVLVARHDLPGAPLADLQMLDAHELDLVHTHWGVVFQANALFSGTVFDNLALWQREVRDAADDAILPLARQALEAVSLPSDDDFLELDHEELSGGMSMRLAVARALVMEPELLFYDEPTTGLDPNSAAQIHDLIHHTHESGETERTTIIITHDKDLLRRLQPRTVMLHDGQVFFDGPYRLFEQSKSPIVRPYFDLMPVLHYRERHA